MGGRGGIRGGTEAKGGGGAGGGGGREGEREGVIRAYRRGVPIKGLHLWQKTCDQRGRNIMPTGKLSVLLDDR